MSVLEAPQTWIAAAAVLVVAAVVLIALAPRRRSGAGEAGEPDAAARPGDDEAVTAPVSPAGAWSGSPAGDGPWADDDATTTTTATDAPTAVTAVRGGVPAGDGPWADEPVTAVTTEVRDAAPSREPSERSSATLPLAAPPRADGPPSRITRRYQPVTDPARADDRAKDRLLAVLLADPAAAVDVVAALGDGATTGAASGSSAAALLRAGLRPDQVATLCGVDEGDLGELVARDLGLLERSGASGPSGDAAQSGRSRTDEPGRAWASAASAPRSTTPTTG